MLANIRPELKKMHGYYILQRVRVVAYGKNCQPLQIDTTAGVLTFSNTRSSTTATIDVGNSSL